MYACICLAVTAADVHACIDEGAETAEEIGERCEAGTGCGSCLGRLDEMIVERGCAARGGRWAHLARQLAG